MHADVGQRRADHGHQLVDHGRRQLDAVRRGGHAGPLRGERAQRGRQVAAALRVHRRRTGGEQRAQRELLLAGQPAQLPGVTAQLAAAAAQVPSTCSTPSCTARVSRSRSSAAASAATARRTRSACRRSTVDANPTVSPTSTISWMSPSSVSGRAWTASNVADTTSAAGQPAADAEGERAGQHRARGPDRAHHRGVRGQLGRRLHERGAGHHRDRDRDVGDREPAAPPGRAPAR